MFAGKKLGKKRIEYDEMTVRKCVSLTKEWSNPLQRAEELISLSSGQQAPEDVKQNLLKAKKIGEKQLQEFFDNRILSNKVGFYEPIKRLKLKNLTSHKGKKKTTKVKGKERTIDSSLKTFSRFISLQGKYNISIPEVLNYELGALPLSIACADRCMVKSNKASLGRELKKIVPIETELPLDCISIFDGMVLLQKVLKHCSIFGEISDHLLMKILSATQKVVFLTMRDN